MMLAQCTVNLSSANSLNLVQRKNLLFSKEFNIAHENSFGKGDIVPNKQFLIVPKRFQSYWRTFHHFHQNWSCHLHALWFMKSFNPLPHMPILGSFNSAANKDMMSKLLTNGDSVFWLSRKHCGKRRNCLLRAISSFPQYFQKLSVVDALKWVRMEERVNITFVESYYNCRRT